jgi:Arc/MetJ family transcription regulator
VPDGGCHGRVGREGRTSAAQGVHLTAHPRVRNPLTDAYQSGIYVHMRTTLNIDGELLTQAQRLSGIREKTALVRAGLEALIARESARRLAALGATEPRLRAVRRRRARGTR